MNKAILYEKVEKEIDLETAKLIFREIDKITQGYTFEHNYPSFLKKIETLKENFGVEKSNLKRGDRK